jgi:hypothetical protein
MVRIRVWYLHDWERTGRGFSTDTPHLRLHFALAKIGDDTANFVIDKNVRSLLVVLFHLTGYSSTSPYLEVTMQHSFFVQVSHSQPHLVNHLQEVNRGVGPKFLRYLTKLPCFMYGLTRNQGGSAEVDEAPKELKNVRM